MYSEKLAISRRGLPKGVFALMYQRANARDADPPKKVHSYTGTMCSPLSPPDLGRGGFEAAPHAMTKPEMAEICVYRILCQYFIQLDQPLNQPSIDAFIVTVQSFGRYQEKYEAQVT